MEKLKIKIKNLSNNLLPEYITDGAAGVDLKAFLPEPCILKPFQRKLINTGLYIEIPEGYEGQVRPRSGLAFKHGITVLNSPGTIDSDYRGEIGVILINLSDTDFLINNGDRIAQLVITSYCKAIFDNTDQINATGRGEGGFGHTGI